MFVQHCAGTITLPRNRPSGCCSHKTAPKPTPPPSNSLNTTSGHAVNHDVSGLRDQGSSFTSCSGPSATRPRHPCVISQHSYRPIITASAAYGPSASVALVFIAPAPAPSIHSVSPQAEDARQLSSKTCRVLHGNKATCHQTAPGTWSFSEQMPPCHTTLGSHHVFIFQSHKKS